MAIIGENDETGMGTYTLSVPSMLIDAGHTHVAVANEEVFRFAAYQGISGSSDTSEQVEVGLYDITGGVDGATLVASTVITATAGPGWLTADITPVALTEGNTYAVAYTSRASGNNFVGVRIFSGGAYNPDTVVTAPGALPSSWSAGTTDPARNMAMYAETQTSSASVELGGENAEVDVEADTGTLVANSEYAFEGVDALALPESETGTLLNTSPAIRVNEVLQDTDSGALIDLESTELVVLGGTAGSRTIVAQGASYEVADGVIEIPGAYTLEDEYLVALVESDERMSILPATVIDRNA